MYWLINKSSEYSHAIYLETAEFPNAGDIHDAQYDAQYDELDAHVGDTIAIVEAERPFQQVVKEIGVRVLCMYEGRRYWSLDAA